MAFTENLRKPAHIVSAVLPLPQIDTLQSLPPSGPFHHPLLSESQSAVESRVQLPSGTHRCPHTPSSLLSFSQLGKFQFGRGSERRRELCSFVRFSSKSIFYAAGISYCSRGLSQGLTFKYISQLFEVMGRGETHQPMCSLTPDHNRKATTLRLNRTQ